MKVGRETMSERASPIDDLVARLAAQSGLEPARIRASKLAQYDLVLSQGIAVQLSIGGGTLFRTRLDPRLIGVDPDAQREFFDKHVDLGSLFLTPKEVIKKLRSLENQPRNYLRRHPAGFEFETGWVWLPLMEPKDGLTAGQAGELQGFHQVKEKLEEYRAAYLAYVEEIAGDLEALKAQTLASVEANAQDAWKRLHLGNGGKMPPDFAEKLAALVEIHFPTAEQVRERCYFHVYYKVYPMPSTLAEDKALAAEYEAEEQKAEAEKWLAWQKARAEEEMVQAELWAERQAQMKRHEMLLAEHQKYLAEERRRKEEQLEPMIAAIAARLHELVANVAEGVRATIGKNGNIPGPVARQVRSLVDDLGPLMMLAGNTELETLVGRLGALTGDGAAPSPESVSGALDALEKAAQVRLDALAPDRAMYLEL